MLTETEIKKLMSPDRDKANDFIVRRKFKKWLDDLYVVFVIILRYLPEKQTKKISRFCFIVSVKPTRSEFIAMISDRLRLHMKTA